MVEFRGMCQSRGRVETQRVVILIIHSSRWGFLARSTPTFVTSEF